MVPIEEETEDIYEAELMWTENIHYFKTPILDQWIVQDLVLRESIDMITQLNEVNPQQTLDLMMLYGSPYIFSDDMVKDGSIYYVLNSHIGSEAFQEMTNEILENFPPSPLDLEGIDF